jgi:hypothetical protein
MNLSQRFEQWEVRCKRKQPFGWRCKRPEHLGSTPCAVVPRWFNFRARLNLRRWDRYYRKFEGGGR